MAKNISYRFGMSEKQTVKIAVNTKDTLSIDLLTPLQGDLKTLSKENYEKLKAEILTDGFSFAIHVWEDVVHNKIYILDGHQRHDTLRRMRKEGFVVPEVPVVFVDAIDMDNAKHKVAAAASQYGDFDQEGAEKFFGSFKELDMTSFTRQFNIPQVDHTAFKFEPLKKDEGPTKTVEFTAGAGGSDKPPKKDKEQFLILITCVDEEDQQDLFGQLEKQGLQCKII